MDPSQAANFVRVVGLEDAAAILWSSTLGYRNPDSKGVAAIGRVAIDAKTDASIVLHCAESLSSIHTAETLPYLHELLGNADSKVRELGVAGFSAFVAKMRIAQAGADSSEALDEVFNPGRRRTLPSSDAPFETEMTRQHYRFGPFRSSAEDAAFVSFWKSWYEQNRFLLAP